MEKKSTNMVFIDLVNFVIYLLILINQADYPVHEIKNNITKSGATANA